MKKSTCWLLGFILAKLVIQFFLVGSAYDLHRDEYLHLDQGRHLAWGYQSVPPFTSWNSWLILQLGRSDFWVRFFPPLYGAITLLVTWKIMQALQANLFALILGATGMLFSALLRLNILYQPNSIDILCWTAIYFFLIKWIMDSNKKWLYSMAVIFAIGFLNKYNIGFLLAGLVPALFLTPHRRLFTLKDTWLAAGLALLLISPNFWWQYENDFPVVRHMRELARTQLVNLDPADFIKEQFLFFLGLIPVTLTGLFCLFFYKPWKQFRVFGFSFLFTIGLFIYFNAKGYYAIGLYPVIIAFGAARVGDWTSKQGRKWLRPLLVFMAIFMLAPIYPILFPLQSPENLAETGKRYKEMGLLRWEDGKDHTLPQDFADMLGWKDLANQVDSLRFELQKSGRTLVICDNYGQAGAINHYSRLTDPDAISFNADYVNWFRLEKPIQNLILVKEVDDGDPERSKEKPFFDTVYLSGSITDQFAREYGTKIFVLKGVKTNLNDILREELKKSTQPKKDINNQ